MELQLIGPHPFARDAQGQQLSRIGTLFLQYNVLYSKPPAVHAWQRLGFIEHVNQDRARRGLDPLSTEEEQVLCANSVDLVFESDHVLIRPDPERIGQVLAADELLQTLIPKAQVRFLGVANARVREAIKRRGEYWRLSTLPKTREGKKRLIFGSKVPIGGLPVYYYNRLTGTRWLTNQEFENLGELDDHTLGEHLEEIREHSLRLNRMGRPEIDFFGADPRQFSSRDFAGAVYNQITPAELRGRFQELRSRFQSAVHQSLGRDDFQNKSWCERMLSTLFLEGNEAQFEQILSGLSPEFYMQIEWLPGGRFEEGEFLLDPIFDEAQSHGGDAERQHLCDPRAKEIILNFTRDYGDLEYINVGSVPESLSLARPQKEGRRAVYFAEFQVRRQPQPVRRFLRLQKWGVWEHLDEGKDLLPSILESDEYTDYSLDRRLGCRQLGMNLNRRSVIRRLNEVYWGTNQLYRGQMIRTTYLERDYVPGIATDKLPLERYARPAYAEQLAVLLGRAAASSLIVGRSLEQARPVFDDGDEVVVEGENGLPSEILVADHSGAFTEYKLSLEDLAADYARPVNNREGVVSDLAHFAQLYLDALREQYLRIQEDYRKRRRGFDNLFKHCKYDPAGSFAFRWECVLRRLDQTPVDQVISAIWRHIRVLNPPPAPGKGT